MIDARERFLAVFSTARPRGGEACVVLTGEDGLERAKTAVELLKLGYAREIVLSGGVDSPPRRVSAKTLYPKLLGMGVAHDRMIVEGESTNTREQAVNVVKLAIEKEWQSVLLCASPYHAARAFLTFLKALQETGTTETIRLVNTSTSHLDWFAPPAGIDRTRLDLFQGEMGKIALYSEHVATFHDGLAYLKYWESAA